jgi:hypothetical protein
VTESTVITAAEQVEAGLLPGGRRPPREPNTIRGLPHDKHGRPIPWFVAVDEHGRPDFRVVRPRGIRTALDARVCWTCGTPLGREVAFVIGPMCVINRRTAEPASHRECARYAADACPFLSTPNMRRRTTGLPEDQVDPAGIAILRNPGVACVWFGRPTGWTVERVPNGILFNVGEPSRVMWRTQGRDATRAEALASLDSGFLLLQEKCQRDRDPARSLAELDEQFEDARRFLPAA